MKRNFITHILECVAIIALSAGLITHCAISNKTINSLNSAISEMTEKIDDIKSDLDATKLELNEIKSDLETTKSVVSELKEDIEELESQLDTKADKETVEELEETIEEMKEIITKLLTWDGNSINTSWYSPTNDSYIIETGVELAGLQEVLNNGETFEDKEILLGDDILLGEAQWTPVSGFKGTFNGDNHVIKDLQVTSTTSAGSTDFSYNALFKDVTDATIKNLIIDGAKMNPGWGASSLGGYEDYDGEKGILVGASHGDTLIENVTIINSFASSYNNSVGGVVAEVRDGTTTLKNITLDSSNVFEAYWGTYDGPVGGLVGMIKNGAHVNMENCNVSCKLNVYNDVCGNYQYYVYRYAGMLCSYLEGKNASNYSDAVTITNCTVTFDNWNQFRYCKNEDNVKFHRINNLDGSWTSEGEPTAHNHTYEVTNENHNLLLAFANIFGFSTGNRGVTSVKENIVDNVDTTSIPGLKIIYLNESSNGF